jgi:dTDP-4-amino-4,6-dideoxygalactose transaminase
MNKTILVTGDKSFIGSHLTEALRSYYKKKHLGIFGLTGCLSFNGNKNIKACGGGAVTNNNKKFD